MSTEPIDVLAFGAHPDDVELNAGGTLLLAKNMGRSIGICHLTNGELGTRGTPEIRRTEAQVAAEKLGASELRFLELPDGHLEVNIQAKKKVVETIRELRPKTILAPFWDDLHPDHSACGKIIKESNFLAGLEKWDQGRSPWRAPSVLYYMSHSPITPTIVVDISETFEAKKEAAKSYRSQFFNQDSQERETFISGSAFWDWWAGRASYWGHFIGVPQGEPFFVDGPIPVSHPFDLFNGFGKYKNA